MANIYLCSFGIPRAKEVRADGPHSKQGALHNVYSGSVEDARNIWTLHMAHFFESFSSARLIEKLIGNSGLEYESARETQRIIIHFATKVKIYLNLLLHLRKYSDLILTGQSCTDQSH